MNIFHFLTICPPEIKDYLLSDHPSQNLSYLKEKYNLSVKERDQMTALTRDLLLGLVAVDDLPNRVSKVLFQKSNVSSQYLADYQQRIVVPNDKFLKKTPEDVRKFKESNSLPEIVVFDMPKLPSGNSTSEKVSTSMGSSRPVPTTSDIRPIRRKLPPPPVPAMVAPRQTVAPATPVSPAVPATLKPETPVLDQFQLRTVDDLINVPAATLQKEPDDEKKLVGRFKQEIQDIANHSGAKRTDIVAGWKKSQIYHTYIEMGNDSIQQGKPIGDVMAFRKAAGKPYLTENQFHAVSEISRLLLR